MLTDPYNNEVEIFGQVGSEPEWTQSDETPKDPDGNPMTFIAKVYTGEYTDDSCEKDIYLFYSDTHTGSFIISNDLKKTATYLIDAAFLPDTLLTKFFNNY